MKNGTDPHAATFIGIATAYPAWSPREKCVITLEDRILNGFMQSCNGMRLPLGSEVSDSIAAYIAWLSADAGEFHCRERLGGLLNYYHSEAA